jgi:hypothetical protein
MNIKLEPPIPEIFPQNGGIFSGKDGELTEQPVTDGRVPIPRCYPVGWGFKEVKIDTVFKISKA